MKNWLSKSLLAQLVSYFSVLSVITLSAVAVGSFFQARTSLETAVINRLTVAAQLKSYQLDRWVESQLRDIVLVSQEVKMRTAVNRLLTADPNDLNYQAAHDTLARHVEDLTDIKPNLRNIRITRNSGFVLFASDDTTLENTYRPLGDPATYFTRDRLDIVVPNFYISPQTQKATITVATPIFDAQGKRMAALIADLDLEEVDTLIRENTGLGKTAETYLVGKAKGTTIFISKQDRNGNTAQERASSEGINRAINQQSSGFDRYENYQGVPVVGVYRWLPDENLALIAEITQSEAFEPARELARGILIIGFCSSGVLLAAVYLFSRRITRPLLAITSAAERLSEGDLSQTVSVSNQDELGQLADSFRRMAAQLQASFKQLQDYSQNLEQKVEERTQELSESKQLLNLLINNIPQSIFWKNKDGVFLGCNHSFTQVAGMTSEEILGKTDYEMPWSKEESDFYLECDRRIMESNTPELGIVETLFQADGRQCWLETSKVPLHDTKGAVIGVIGIFQDITPYKEAEKAAQQANQAKSTFIANMSHELRSPLNAILGFAQIMTRSQTLGREHQENVGIIYRSGEHLLSLINNILDLSKIEAGKTTLNPKNFDLHRLLDDIDDMFKIKAEEKNLHLMMEYEPDLIRYVSTDEIKLRQVLINLINNALKFTQAGGVAIRACNLKTKSQAEVLDATSSMLHFEIEDSGAGIAEEELEHLFEAFTQTETGKKAQEGTGLGLSISSKFVHLMGGDIKVKSVVGQGTTFLFDIQVTEVTASDIATHQPSRRVIALEANQPKYRILIVDDKPINRQLLIKLLYPLGFELQEASNGQEAVDIWEKWEPHLIWMDMRMPVMDGHTASQIIKSHLKGQATAIIALTASILEEEKAVVMSAGCDDFVRKPFREEEIFDAMNKHIGVQYIYEDLILENMAKTLTKEVLNPEVMAEIPIVILDQLEEAVMFSDTEIIATLIEKIATHNSSLALALKTSLYNFEYEKVLSLISATKKAESR